MELFTEELAPYALVDPRDLQEVRRHQLVQAVVFVEHAEAVRQDLCDLGVGHLAVEGLVFHSSKVPIIVGA